MLDTLPQKLQGEGRALLTKIPYAETREEAERQRDAFQAWATKKGVPTAGRRLAEDWERLVTFYAFPKEHWKHLRTTNVVESPFAAPELLPEVAEGVAYLNGERAKRGNEKASRLIFFTHPLTRPPFRISPGEQSRGGATVSGCRSSCLSSQETLRALQPMFEAEKDRAIGDLIDPVGAVAGLPQTPAKLAALVAAQQPGRPEPSRLLWAVAGRRDRIHLGRLIRCIAIGGTRWAARTSFSTSALSGRPCS